MSARAHGFTLIEVMVALVIVAFGMGAVLAALTSSANNISALHDKTLAQWIALNIVADTRLNLQAPVTGSTEGDVKAFGNADWHWQQDVAPIPSVPGLLEIVVRVRRTGTSTAGSSSGAAARATGSSSSGSSTGFAGPSSTLSPSAFAGGAGYSSGGLGGSAGFASSGGFGSFGASSSSSGGLGSVTAALPKLSGSGKDQNWLATVIGFRGDAIAAANGESPDWAGTALAGTASSSSSSGGGGASSGAILNPGTSPVNGLFNGGSSSTGVPPPLAPGASSSGG